MGKKKIAHYTESVGDLFFSDYISRKDYSIQYKKYIKTVLRRLNELYVGCNYTLVKKLPDIFPPAPFAVLLKRYIQFCKNTGNKKNTITKKRKFCLDFLNNINDAGCNKISQFASKYICMSIIKINNKDSFAVIRSFLQYMYENGILKNDFSGIIPKYRRVISLPTTYTNDEILSLENIINRTTKTGKRNYAVILLASRLGIRAGDITEMTLDNIDFNNNKISFIQNKTGRALSLPLLPEIREAIQDYLQFARPNVRINYLFIKANAPFDKISTSAIRHALTGYFKLAGINISNKKHGSHTLRSSMASSMINRDIPYEVVRKTLGHTDPQAIKRYAKVDIKNLRLYAIGVPAPSGIFAAALRGRN